MVRAFKFANKNLVPFFDLTLERTGRRRRRRPHLRGGNYNWIFFGPSYGLVFVCNDFSLANHFGRRTMHATGLKWTEIGEKQKNKRWMMVFFVMERKKTDVLLQPWASSRPRLAGASQVVFIMRQSRIQILGCGCSPHLADWMRRSATSRRWEVKVQKTQRNVSFWNTIFLYTGEIPHMFVFWGESEPMASCDALWTPRVTAVPAASRRCCATSVCAHQRCTRPAHFYTACADVDGFHPLTFY